MSQAAGLLSQAAGLLSQAAGLFVGIWISPFLHVEETTIAFVLHECGTKITKNHEITHHLYGFLYNNTKKVRRMKVTFRIIS